jgi:hypothetical protein
MTQSTLRSAAVLLAAVALAVAGCSGGEGTLKGKVTYQGKPVIYGSVIAVGPDGLRQSAGLKEDGSYQFEKLRAGSYKLSVQSPEPRDRNSLPPEMRAPPGLPGGPPANLKPIDKSKWMQLPDLYGDPDTSGITTTVKRGENQYDVELK